MLVARSLLVDCLAGYLAGYLACLAGKPPFLLRVKARVKARFKARVKVRVKARVKVRVKVRVTKGWLLRLLGWFLQMRRAQIFQFALRQTVALNRTAWQCLQSVCRAALADP